ncbi:MAG: hypothetical protein AB7R89_24085 [Dehalococcoidia bacterium]
MIARVLEAAGLSTTSISLVREHTLAIKPPRALFVPFPFGSALGRANDPALQHRVLRAALDLFSESAGPVLRDFPDEGGGHVRPAPLQASSVPAEGSIPDVAMETTQIRRYYEQWIERQGKTMVGLSGVPPVRFRGVIRFLEAYADGEPADMRERPEDVPLPLFIRYCADDLKAMYYEARMMAKPDIDGEGLARWFWGSTAAGSLLRCVRDRMDASDDPREKAMAFGVAR